MKISALSQIFTMIVSKPSMFFRMRERGHNNQELKFSRSTCLLDAHEGGLPM